MMKFPWTTKQSPAPVSRLTELVRGSSSMTDIPPDVMAEAERRVRAADRPRLKPSRPRLTQKKRNFMRFGLSGVKPF